MSKEITRKEFLTNTSKYAIGAVAGVAGLDILAGGKILAGTKNPTWPWPYQPLDPDTVRDRAHYLYYNGMACCAGVFGAILDSLKTVVGEPYTNLPSEIMYYGGGGGVGWGTLCGTLNGAAAIISLCVDKTNANKIINELWGWYCQAEFPSDTANDFAVQGKYTEKKYNDALPQNVSGSPLCHVSVTEWCITAQKKVGDIERKERCARLAGDVAAKTVEYLNALYAQQFTYTYVTPADIQQCLACHGPAVLNNVMTQLNCKTCHGDPHKPPAGVVLDNNNIPEDFLLSQNYPNPFNPSTKMQISVARPEKVSLIIYDVMGREVKRLINYDLMNAGKYTVDWDGTDNFGNKVASGIYFAKMTAGAFHMTKKMNLVK